MSLPPAPSSDRSDAPTAAPARPLRQLALQFAAVLAVLSLAWPYYGFRGEELPWPQTAFAIGAIALLLATLSCQPWWWRILHAIFAPLAWGVAQLQVDPGWFLLAFMLLLLVYRGALSGQIPLYFSSRQTVHALAALTREYHDLRFIDLGAGIGSIVQPLAAARADAFFAAVENAPATWLVGRVRTLATANCTWQWGDFWQTDLAAYNVVYAFLSPTPMAALWEKVGREMRPGSLFISNSFAVPGVAAAHEIDVDDHRHTRLYCYRV